MKKITTLNAMIVAMMSVVPAQADVLHGYLEQKVQPETTPAVPPSSTPTVAPTSDPISGGVEALVPNSYPSGYQGAWHCITTVTDSGVAAIPSGQVMLSDVVFARQGDGRVTAAWTQPGWTESQSEVTPFSVKEARVDRTNYYVNKDLEQSWAARSRDQFTQTSRNAITAKSYVDQYIDGQFVGRYRTTSLLQRQPGSDIALAK